MCPVGNTLALESDEKYTCTVSFLSLYTFSAALPSQKCVLSLDDVMLQVQRIYVHRGSVGGGPGGGSKVIQRGKCYLLLESEAFMQHLKNRTVVNLDAPTRVVTSPRGLAHRLKGPSRARTPPLPPPPTLI